MAKRYAEFVSAKIYDIRTYISSVDVRVYQYDVHWERIKLFWNTDLFKRLQCRVYMECGPSRRDSICLTGELGKTIRLLIIIIFGLNPKVILANWERGPINEKNKNKTNGAWFAFEIDKRPSNLGNQAPLPQLDNITFWIRHTQTTLHFFVVL